MATAKQVVDTIVANSPVLAASVPFGRSATLQETGGAILSYTPFMNEFVSGLVNRILFQEVHDSVYQNHLRMFKGVEVPYGTDVQDSIANPAVATPYDRTALADVLSPTPPDVKTVYYRRNRQDKYKVTVYDEELKGAFVGPDAFNRFVNMIRNTLYSGDNIDEYRLMVKPIADALDASHIHTTSFTEASYDTTAAFSNAIITEARARYLMMQFPSSDYNMYQTVATAAGISDATPLTTWTTPDRMSIIIRADFAAMTDVESLAKAFNMSKADFLGRQVIVDKFGDGTTSSKTIAIVLDNTAIRAHDNLYKMTETPYNAATMSRTYYLHHWETIAFSPLANAWALVTSA